jgi:Lon protease-like protein
MAPTEPLTSIPETAPVFPLPNVVFFPHTVLPLHIFEPRYREMIADAESREGLIAMSLLKPGWEKDETRSPDYFDVGTLGRMTSLTRTGDGRYHLKLVGVCKVAFGEIVRYSPYRTARISPVVETIPRDDSPESRDDLVKLLGACAVLVQEISEKQFPMVAVKEGLPYEPVVNSVCAHVGLPPQVKQSLLEIDEVRERCLKLTEFLEAHLQRVVLSRGSRVEGLEAGPIN